MSGSQTWNGAIASLNNKLTTIKNNGYWKTSGQKTLFPVEFSVNSKKSVKFKVPNKPYKRELPYKNKPEENEPNIKYFRPPSIEYVEFLLKDANK